MTKQWIQALLAIFIIIVVGCTRMVTPDNKERVEYLNRITREDVIGYLRNTCGFRHTKSNSFDLTPVLYKGDTVMFLVNYDKGWELLSADKRAPMVIMQADEGHMTIDSLFMNPSEQLFGQWVSERISELRKDDKREVVDSTISNWINRGFTDLGEQWILISTDTVVVEQSISDHLTQTRWGQEYPWHQQAPYIAYEYYLSNAAYSSTNEIHCPGGCTNVACAQLLYYLHYKIGVPDKAYGDCDNTYLLYPGGSLIVSASMLNLDPTTYSSSIWDQMSKSSTVASDSTRYASILIAQMGMLTESLYKSYLTFTPVNNHGAMLNDDFGLSFSTSSSFGFGIVLNQIINNEMPVLVDLCYMDSNHNQTDGHTAIIDACKYNNYLINKTYVVITPPNGNNPGSYEYRYLQSALVEKYIGFNWGHAGIDMLSSGTVKWYNADAISWVGGGHTYNCVYKMWYGFHD